MDTIDLNKYVVRNEDGSVDYDSTCEKLEEDVKSWDEEHKSDQAPILGALHSVFDSNPGKAFSIQSLTAAVFTALHGSPENYASIAERVNLAVKGNPQLFGQSRGPKGGTRRLTDTTTATTN